MATWQNSSLTPPLRAAEMAQRGKVLADNLSLILETHTVEELTPQSCSTHLCSNTMVHAWRHPQIST